jgi:hypothetical protein
MEEKENPDIVKKIRINVPELVGLKNGEQIYYNNNE